ncbi:hypothetical protein ABIC76_004910 [Ralstonia sp. 1138]
MEQPDGLVGCPALSSTVGRRHLEEHRQIFALTSTGEGCELTPNAAEHAA